jgi:hypothetical protein
MIKVKQMIQVYHAAWMLLAILTIAFGVDGLVQRDDGDSGGMLRTIGPGVTALVGYYAYSTANRRRTGVAIGRIETLLTPDDGASRRGETERG